MVSTDDNHWRCQYLAHCQPIECEIADVIVRDPVKFHEEPEDAV